jgi:hypothetical protein
MTKRALFVVVGLLGCSLTLSAQRAQQPDRFALNQSRIVSTHALDLSTLNNAYYGFSALTILDGRPLSLSNAYTTFEPAPLDFPPIESAEFSTKVRTAGPTARDSDSKRVQLQPKVFDYVHGEVGVLYGTTVGSSRFSREVESGYILGELGNDKYQINVGAFYEHSSGHIPRFGR